MTEYQLPGEDASARLGPLDEAARLADVADRMRRCLQELDELQLWKAGAHLTLAIATIEAEVIFPTRPRI